MEPDIEYLEAIGRGIDVYTNTLSEVCNQIQSQIPSEEWLKGNVA
jgi:hypothetical protein